MGSKIPQVSNIYCISILLWLATNSIKSVLVRVTLEKNEGQMFQWNCAEIFRRIAGYFVGRIKPEKRDEAHTAYKNAIESFNMIENDSKAQWADFGTLLNGVAHMKLG